MLPGKSIIDIFLYISCIIQIKTHVIDLKGKTKTLKLCYFTYITNIRRKI